MIIKKIIAVFLCFIFVFGFFSCKKPAQKEIDNALILENYSDDLQFSHYESLYFIPGSRHYDFYAPYKSFNPSFEYDESLLEIFDPEFIRSNIIELYSIYFTSEKIPGMIQFPNNEIFDEYIVKFEKDPMVTKEVLEELLQYEYSIFVIETGLGIETENFISTDAYSPYQGGPRYWLSDENLAYFLGDDFIYEMDILSAWVKEKKWNDLNSTIYRLDRYMNVYTCDPANDLPVINDIKKVQPAAGRPNTYTTQTGSYTFTPPASEIETFENSDGSLDLMWTNEKDVK